MSAREGFRRLVIFYNRRWWIILIAPAVLFLYTIFLQGPPRGVAPALWVAFGVALLGAVMLGLLAIALWVVFGFLAHDPSSPNWRDNALQQPRND